MNKITISFKNIKRDKFIYEYISKQEEKSQFIKDAVMHLIRHLEDYDDET